MRFGQTSGTKWPTPPRRDCAPLLLQRVYMCAINLVKCKKTRTAFGNIASPLLLQLVYMCAINLVKCKKTTTAFGNIASTPHAGITDPQGHRDVMLLQLG